MRFVVLAGELSSYRCQKDPRIRRRAIRLRGDLGSSNPLGSWLKAELPRVSEAVAVRPRAIRDRDMNDTRECEMVQRSGRHDSLRTNGLKSILPALAIILLSPPAPSIAQDSRAYAGASGLVSIQGSHVQGSAPSLPTTGAGGTTVGVGLEAGAFLTPRIALGMEVSLPRHFTSIQETDYSRVFQQKSRHRDVVLSAVVRAVLGASSRLRVDLIAGSSVISESTQQQRRDQQSPLPSYPPVFGPYSDEYSFARWTLGGLVGADVEMAIGPHVALVPQIRAHFIQRSSDPSEQGWALGLNTLVLRPALLVRTTF